MSVKKSPKGESYKTGLNLKLINRFRNYMLEADPAKQVIYLKLIRRYANQLIRRIGGEATMAPIQQIEGSIAKKEIAEEVSNIPNAIGKGLGESLK